MLSVWLHVFLCMYACTRYFQPSFITLWSITLRRNHNSVFYHLGQVLSVLELPIYKVMICNLSCLASSAQYYVCEIYPCHCVTVAHSFLLPYSI